MRGISIPTRTKKICTTLAIAGLLVSALAAQGPPPSQGNVVVEPGADLFKSPAALGSEYDIGNCMIPGEFFEVGVPELTGCEVPAVPSDPGDPNSPLSFVLGLEGVPLQTFQGFEVGTIDTVVQRLQPLDFGVNPMVEVSASTPVEVVALKLISTEPIEVTCDQGVTRWIAQVEVDEDTGPSLGQMDVTLQPDLNGGTASSVLDICPRVRFTRIDPGSSGSFEVFPCDLLCGPQLVGETTWSLESPDPDNALRIRGLTSDNFFFTELLTPAEAALVDAAAPVTKMDACNPDCPCIFKYPHLSANHRHQACLPCPCDADMQEPEVNPPDDLTVECTETGGTSRFATCSDNTLCIVDWLDTATCVDQPGDDPDKISSCGALAPPIFFAADCTETGKRNPVTFQAVDECCNDHTETANVFVQDTTAPNVAMGGTDLDCLTPPNGGVHCFTQDDGAFEFDRIRDLFTSDVCHDVADWKFTECISDQPDSGPGSGNRTGDCTIGLDQRSVCIRSERDGGMGDGRRYEIKIEASDECGNTSGSTTIGFVHVPPNDPPDGTCIEVEPPCRPECSAEPTSGQADLEVSFSDTTRCQGIEIESWTWDFGDGDTLSGNDPDPKHTYTSAGTFSPRLELTLEGGDVTLTASCPDIMVEPVPEPPVAQCSASPTSGEASLEVDFTNQSMAGSAAITSFAWDFKDGSTSTAENPSHTFSSSGTFDVMLTVTDANGLSDTATCSVSVEPPPPVDLVAACSSTSTSADPLVVSFMDESTVSGSIITAHLWDFKDGTTSTEQNPVHTFTDSGVYDVMLTVTAANSQSATATCTVAVAGRCFEDLGPGGGAGNGQEINVAKVLGLPYTAVTVTKIEQDEPISAPPSQCGNKTPDGCIGDSPFIIEIRPETCSGPAGNDRFYHVTFDLPAGVTSPCGNVLRLCKPQNQGSGGTCDDANDDIDDLRVDSTDGGQSCSL